MGVDIVFLAIVIMDALLMTLTLVRAAQLGVLTWGSFTGRIVFGIIVSLKLWVYAILLDFFAATFWPSWVAANRVPIRYFLAVYLLVQSLGTLIALERLARRNP